MNPSVSIVLMIVSTVLSAIGMLNIKLGSRIKKVYLSKSFWIGVVCYGFATIASILALKWGQLTLLYPIASLNYVWASFLSMKYLKEKMNNLKWAGMCCILTGVIIIV
jgi:drug/metabolite transporter (DMT)-like permease